MKVHPQVQAVLDEVNGLEVRSVWDRAIADVRADFHALVVGYANPGPEVARVENRMAPAPHGSVPVRIYWPAASKTDQALPVFVYFHGSGFVVLGVGSFDHVCRSLCLKADCIVVWVDYRKAPENKFPKPSDDAWAATKALAQTA